MAPNRKIKRLNDLLRQELGTDGGVYAWLWSESEELQRPMRVLDVDGSPVFEYKEQPNGLTLAEPVYIKRKTCVMADKQWVLARLLPPALSPHEWDKVFGTYQAYPANGEWAPCDPVYLPQGKDPSEQDTWDVIHAIRRQRKVTNADWDSETMAALEKRETSRHGEILDSIKDAAPAFYNVPGKKGRISFPTV